ncbi:MAG: GreA/GreB family elongation factor, partial [Bdellovibrionota bacterium]
MSKAFVKEDSELNSDLPLDFIIDDLDPSVEDGGELLSAGGSVKNYITSAGYQRLKAEMDSLIHEDFAKLSQTIGEIGDSPENLELAFAKRRLKEVESRIHFLKRRLDLAEVVDPLQQTGDMVLFGATVTVLDEKETQHVYRIVGVDEAEAKSGKVSWSSPIARALLPGRFRLCDFPTPPAPWHTRRMIARRVACSVPIAR